MSKNKVPPDLQLWIDARKRFHLSHAHVQMARELGMNPTKLGSLANPRQEQWKSPLGEYLEHLYFKRFGCERPQVVMSIEDLYRARAATKRACKEARHQPTDLTNNGTQET